MSYYKIIGGKTLSGALRLQGAKNCVLPFLAAALLSAEGRVCLTDVPQLSDVFDSYEILRLLGCKVFPEQNEVSVDATNAAVVPIGEALCGRMRSSVLFLGPLLARFGYAELALPGGCVLGERPIDIHIAALMQMGVRFSFSEERICAHTPYGLRGADIHLRYPSVGATENILMAATLAKGETVLYNRAMEPEIDALIELLKAMGADISCRPDCVTVRGVQGLHGCEKRVLADRICAFTYFAAALATDGEITLENCPAGLLGAPLEALAAAGGAICRKGESLTLKRASPFILPVPETKSGPYPAFPSDAGAILAALLCLAQGKSVFEETVFSERFAVMGELRKMGADITINGARAEINGKEKLCGSSLYASDLRAGAALTVAALAAEGESRVEGVHYIERGYERFVQNLSLLGAQIEKKE